MVLGEPWEQGMKGDEGSDFARFRETHILVSDLTQLFVCLHTLGLKTISFTIVSD